MLEFKKMKEEFLQLTASNGARHNSTSVEEDMMEESESADPEFT